uniref:Uncharacterized protein n=1 Tax=Romanomermis culicivorax TaxID=13658 RepID=A0A915IMF2_ROMCU
MGARPRLLVGERPGKVEVEEYSKRLFNVPSFGNVGRTSKDFIRDKVAPNFDVALLEISFFGVIFEDKKFESPIVR